MPTRALVVYSHTHWDRAWYASFELFRFKLVEHMDDVIAHLERHPEFRHYCLDGQTAMAEDYLQVRPEAEGRLRALVAAGRIEVGPWYVQPDCFLPSAEALVRNLLHGARIARRLGAVMRVGYLPDSFGFPSELPTILAGFGIDSMVFSRGMDACADRIGCEFWWTAASGERVLGLWIPQGYGAGCNLGYLTWWGDPRRQDFQVEHGIARLRKNIADHQRYSRSGVTVVPEGVDHCPLNKGVPAVMAAARTKMPEERPRHGTLRSYVDAVRASGADFASFAGELASAAKGVQLRGVHSARLYLKQANHAAETLLERWSEPLAAAATAWAGADDRLAQLRHVWMLLMQNHPHDDICGCSVDVVHREDELRASSVMEVGETIRREAAIALSHAMDFTAQEGIPLVVYNPLAAELDGVQEICLDLEAPDLPTGPIRLIDHQGRPLAVQVIARELHEEVWIRFVDYKRTRVRLLVDLAIPPCGWTTVYLSPSTAAASPAPAWRGAASSGEDWIANDLLRVRIRADGRFDLTVLRSGRTYAALHELVDEGDRGDEYDFCPVEGRPAISSAGVRALIRCGHDGPRAWAEIDLRLEVPAGVGPAEAAPGLATLRLRTRLTLLAGSPRLDLHTECENTARDHRLRAHFPSGLAGSTHLVEEAYAVVRREDRMAAAADWAALPAPTAHQKSLVSLDDGADGLALLNRGLTEYEILPDRTIAITLVRAVGMRSRGDLATRAGHSGPALATPDAQCQRTLRCAYALVPHRGDARAVRVLAEARRFTAPAWSFRGDEQVETDSRRFDDPALSAAIRFEAPPRGGHLPAHGSLVAIEGSDEVEITAIKHAEQGTGVVVRLCSHADHALVALARIGFPLARAARVELSEEAIEPLTIENGRVSVPMPPRGLVTLLLEPVAPRALSA